MADANQTSWKDIAGFADAGTLFMEPDVGEELVASLNKYIFRLGGMSNSIARVKYVTGFGGFISGEKLAEKFSLKGSGGPDAIDKRMKEHIDQAKLMIDMINKAMANYRSTDNAARKRVIAAGGAV